ncbi:MAG: hypothetical protein MUC60_00260 [Oscillatoria sp. Prado101]|nr:hypothetical protein [Oscillatoria sp. Prado101]
MPVIEGGVSPEGAGRSVVPVLQCYSWGGFFISKAAPASLAAMKALAQWRRRTAPPSALVRS